MVSSQLVIYDFDWSLADQDTDRYVLEVLAPDLRRHAKTMKSEPQNTVQWTDHMAFCLNELHKRGNSRKEIEDVLRGMPFHPAMARAVRLLKDAKDPKTTFLCLSNSNSIYISTILEDQGLTEIFDEIITNPAKWTADGRLDLRRRIDPTALQHTCKIGCAPNMCKGDELGDYLKRSNTKFDRVIYVGDGGNDFCPILRLRTSDIAYVRRYRGLESRIKNEGKAAMLKATVKYWAGAWEIEEHFKELIASV